MGQGDPSREHQARVISPTFQNSFMRFFSMMIVCVPSRKHDVALAGRIDQQRKQRLRHVGRRSRSHSALTRKVGTVILAGS